MPPPLIPEAIARIVARAPDPPQEAAKRFLANAQAHGIDPALCWATIDTAPPRIRQVCLAVPGSGRTANLFLAPPLEGVDERAQREERVAILHRIAEELASVSQGRVRVVQSLPDPEEPWASEAFLLGGFTHCGTLAYMRTRLRKGEERVDPSPPTGVTIQGVAELGDISGWRPRLERALDASYVGSLDCPELWGLRETSDVLDSHLATGEWDPSLWWLIEREGEPAGVAFYNALGDGVGCELVYIGLAPELRGKGLGARLLSLGMHACARLGLREMTCAVDRRNAPALRLYARRGFREFAQREAFVRRVSDA